MAVGFRLRRSDRTTDPLGFQPPLSRWTPNTDRHRSLGSPWRPLDLPPRGSTWPTSNREPRPFIPPRPLPSLGAPRSLDLTRPGVTFEPPDTSTASSTSVCVCVCVCGHAMRPWTLLWSLCRNGSTPLDELTITTLKSVRMHSAEQRSTSTVERFDILNK